MNGLFGLTASEKKALEPLRTGASTKQLVNRLHQLEHLRESEFIKMEAPGTKILDVARCQVDVTLISVAMEATSLRARAAWMRAAVERSPIPYVADVFKVWARKRST